MVHRKEKKSHVLIKVKQSHAELHNTIADTLQRTPLTYASVRSPVARDFDPALVGVDPPTDVTGLGKDRSMGALSHLGRPLPCFSGVSRERWAAGGLSQAQVTERIDQAGLQYDWDSGDHGNAHSIGRGLAYTPHVYSAVRSPSQRFADDGATARHHPNGAAAFRRRVNDLQYDAEVGWSGVRGYSTPTGHFPAEAVRSYIGTRERPHQLVFWPHTRKHPFSSGDGPANTLRRRRRVERQYAQPTKLGKQRRLRPQSAPVQSMIAQEARAEILAVCARVHKRNPVINRRLAKKSRQPPRSAPRQHRAEGHEMVQQSRLAVTAAVERKYRMTTPFLRYHLSAGGLDGTLGEWERDAELRTRTRTKTKSTPSTKAVRSKEGGHTISEGESV